MLGPLRKLLNNLLTPQAIKVLGPQTTARYIYTLFQCFPAILKTRNFQELDRQMAPYANAFHYGPHQFRLDCQYCDQTTQDGSFTFGAIRELYIKDCYFKHHPKGTYESIRTAVDLGANRGVFSVLLAAQAQFVLSVEAQTQFIPIIRHNMESNGFRHYVLEQLYLGAPNSLPVNAPSLASLDELFQKHKLDSIDFLKMDIEGSEFSLFLSPEWLRKVRAMSLEVHPEEGPPAMLVDTLKRHGFSVILADPDLTIRQQIPPQGGFLYAWKTPF